MTENNDFNIYLLKYENTKQQRPPPTHNLTDRKDKDNFFFILLKETYSLPISKYLEDTAITQTLAVFHRHVGTLRPSNTRILLYAEVHMLPVKYHCFLLSIPKC